MKPLFLFALLSFSFILSSTGEEQPNHQMEVMKKPLRVTTSHKFNLTAEQVWKLIAGFNTLPNYHAAITTSELSEGGMVRKIGISEAAGGGHVVERLVYLNDETREFSYKITELINSPLPFRNYQAFVRLVSHDDNSCTLHWGSFFTVEGSSEKEADELAKAIYQGCYDGITKVLKKE